MDVQSFTSQLLSWLTRPLVKLGSSSISVGTLVVGLGFIVLVWWLVSFVERTIIRVTGLQAREVGGVVILAERILKMGDFVELGSGVRGNVKETAMRHTHITTNDAMDILVPNAEFTDGRVINWTYDNAFRRVRVPFGVAYGVRKKQVLEAGVAAAKAVPGVLDQPGREPTVWLVGYGDNSMDCELVIWADRELTTRPGNTHTNLMWALDTELVRRGL
jgi:small-conductance mechanosensitive channel